MPQFRSQGHGVLVNIGSLYGRVSSPYVSAYVASKWALIGFSEVLRQEVRDAPGLAVCQVLPGAVDTPIYRQAANYVGREIRPLPPVVSPQRVVAAVVPVDHPQAEFIVGQTHHLGAWAHQVVPRLYDRVVGSLVDQFALRKAPSHAHAGNVFTPNPSLNAVDDNWRRHDHRRIGKALAVGAGIAAVSAAATSRFRSRSP
jgi:hypothetical protein